LAPHRGGLEEEGVWWLGGVAQELLQGFSGLLGHAQQVGGDDSLRVPLENVEVGGGSFSWIEVGAIKLSRNSSIALLHNVASSSSSAVVSDGM
jgi:hypothetical protein